MRIPRSLTHRLVIASVLAIVLVTLVLIPITWSNTTTRFESSRLTAKTLLEAEYDALLQGMNESLNHALAIAEFPSVRQHLDRIRQTQNPYQDVWSDQNEDQIRGMLSTLLTHFGRYTRLVVIDTDGRQRLSTEDPPESEILHRNHLYFREAMAMNPRSLYLSAPYPDPSRSGQEVYVIDISTPIVSSEGEQLGVLLLTLNWNYLLRTLPHAMGANAQASALLVDGQGHSLLPVSHGPVAFGDSLKDHKRVIWLEMETRNRGELLLDDQLVVFQTHDLRTHHFRTAAMQVLSVPGSQPWRIAISVPRPDVAFLIAESPWKTSLVVLTYGLAIGFSVFWVLSNHHQRSLKEKAENLSRNARTYARELTDLYENAPCGYHSLDEQGVIQKINRKELQWLGYSRDELVGRRYYRDLVSPETRDAFDEAFKAVLAGGHEGSAEIELMCKNGEKLPVAIEATAQTNASGFQYSRAMVFDLTDRKQLEDLLTTQAMTDPLTGLGNRRFLETQAELEIPRSRRSGEPLTLIAADLDRFKRINDDYGHNVGDRVLQEFAKTAQTELRDGDILCRMGGEEFTVLLPNTSKEHALMVAERLRAAVETNPAEVGTDTTEDGYLSYTASLGVTLVLQDEDSLKPAIKRADEALYSAKEAGRNRVTWRDPIPHHYNLSNRGHPRSPGTWSLSPVRQDSRGSYSIRLQRVSACHQGTGI